MAKGYKSILIISDTHFPYHHPDTICFLKMLKQKYRPDKVVHIGDELDFHAISFHPSDPDLFSSGHELKEAIKYVGQLHKIFPRMDILESNHGSMVYRKMKFHGIPMDVVRSYKNVLGVEDDWQWHFDLTLKMSDGNKVYFCHGKTGAHGRLSQSMGMSTVQGHYHEKFEVIYWANPNGLYFDVRVGCLANDKSLAMAYNNTNLKRPIMGCAVIVDGQPKLCPMILNERGRWIKKIV